MAQRDWGNGIGVLKKCSEVFAGKFVNKKLVKGRYLNTAADFILDGEFNGEGLECENGIRYNKDSIING